MPKISKKVGGDFFNPTTDLRQGDKVKQGMLGIQTYKFIEYQNNGNGIDAIIEPVAGGQQELILASKLVKTTLGGKRNTKKGRKSKKTKRSKKSGKTRKSKK